MYSVGQDTECAAILQTAAVVQKLQENRFP